MLLCDRDDDGDVDDDDDGVDDDDDNDDKDDGDGNDDAIYTMYIYIWVFITCLLLIDYTNITYLRATVTSFYHDNGNETIRH